MSIKVIEYSYVSVLLKVKDKNEYRSVSRMRQKDKIGML